MFLQHLYLGPTFSSLISAILSFEAVVVAKVSHLPVQLSRMHFLPGLESKGFFVSLPGLCDVELDLEIIALENDKKNWNLSFRIQEGAYKI